MTRFKTTIIAAATGLSLCAGLAMADPSDRGAYVQTSPRDRAYMPAQGGQQYGGRETASRSLVGAAFQPQSGSKANVVQSGRNNSAEVTQRGDNKRALIIQRGDDTDVTIDQHGEGPGRAIIYTW